MEHEELTSPPLPGVMIGFTSPGFEGPSPVGKAAMGHECSKGELGGGVVAHLHGGPLWPDVDVVAVELLAQGVRATQRRVAPGQDQQGLGLTEAAERVLHSQRQAVTHRPGEAGRTAGKTGKAVGGTSFSIMTSRSLGECFHRVPPRRWLHTSGTSLSLHAAFLSVALEKWAGTHLCAKSSSQVLGL
jgi:hypothetical protein